MSCTTGSTSPSTFSRPPSPSTTADSSGSKVDSYVLPSPFYPPSLCQDRPLKTSKCSLPKEFPSLPDPARPDAADPTDEGTPDEWIVRDRRLVRLTGKWPFNCEAPLTDLFDAGFLTPTRLFYVRNHGAVPRVSLANAESWTIEVTGLCANPCTLTLRDLLNPALFEPVTLPATMVCAGNRRKEQNVVRKSLGFSWGPAGLSTALWTGVYLADVLDYVRADRKARHVVFEGADDLPDGKYGTSQKIGRAMRRDQAMMLCWAMNGEALEPDHGFPLRLVVPGQIGGRSVKWLKKIELSERESQHHLHFWDNKVLPTTLMPEQARKERHWWYDPRFIITDLNTNAVIAHPAHDEILSIPTNCDETKTYTVKGYAYAGGGRRITRVEVSLDGGSVWQLADIDYPEDLYRQRAHKDELWGTLDLTAREESFCWAFWRLDVPLTALASLGRGSLCVRAGDEGLSGQPDTMYWNPTGMMNNCWFRVAALPVKKEDGSTIISFEHPTQPGLLPGGWMQRFKDDNRDILRPTFTAAPTTEDIEIETQAVEKSKKPTIVMTKDGVDRKISWDEVHAHSQEHEPWFVVHGEVYDGTAFLKKHPGGPESITLIAGEDATEDFMAIHSLDAKLQLADYHIGTLIPAEEKHVDAAEPTSSEPDAVFLHKSKWKKAPLLSVTKVNHDSRIFRFALEHPTQLLGLPTGQHIYVRLRRKASPADQEDAVDGTVIEGELVQRAYTPISSDDVQGHIDLLIKVYHRTTAFPNGGKMTLGFEELEVGDCVELKGPLGSFEWLGKSTLRYRGVEKRATKIGLVCGGSGITPIFQVLRAVINDQQDSETQLFMINANKTVDDILLAAEIEQLERTAGPDRVRKHLVLSKGHDGWAHGRGRITVDTLRQHLPPPTPETMILVCGPDPMIENIVKPGLLSLGFDLDTQLVVF